jgi:hypothetical protein
MFARPKLSAAFASALLFKAGMAVAGVDTFQRDENSCTGVFRGAIIVFASHPPTEAIFRARVTELEILRHFSFAARNTG